MSTDKFPSNPLPLWMKLLIIAAALPLLAFPKLMGLCAPESTAEILLWLYPGCILLYAVLEWRCWAQRPELTWILLVVELLTHGAMWILADPTILLP